LSLDRLPAYGARPTLKRVVEQGKVITAAGVSSGIDMALTLAAHIAGDDAAQAIQLVNRVRSAAAVPGRLTPRPPPRNIVEGLRARMRARMERATRRPRPGRPDPRPVMERRRLGRTDNGRERARLRRLRDRLRAGLRADGGTASSAERSTPGST